MSLVKEKKKIFKSNPRIILEEFYSAAHVRIFLRFKFPPKASTRERERQEAMKWAWGGEEIYYPCTLWEFLTHKRWLKEGGIWNIADNVLKMNCYALDPFLVVLIWLFMRWSSREGFCDTFNYISRRHVGSMCMFCHSLRIHAQTNSHTNGSHIKLWNMGERYDPWTH